MRGHGCTIVGATAQEAIYRAIFTKQNAAIQTASLGLSAAFAACGSDGIEADVYRRQQQHALEVEFLRDDELSGTLEMTRFGWSRAWSLWLREVETAALYSYSEE